MILETNLMRINYANPINLTGSFASENLKGITCNCKCYSKCTRGSAAINLFIIERCM